MATTTAFDPRVEHISGLYTAPANSTSLYTFWWPNEPDKGNQYFNVSIAPQFDSPAYPEMSPLVEVSRQWLYVVDGPGKVRTVLHLGLRNDNAFQVNFLANHVRVRNP
jgi:hypothetical protein